MIVTVSDWVKIKATALCIPRKGAIQVQNIIIGEADSIAVISQFCAPLSRVLFQVPGPYMQMVSSP